jgi:hypothetical protein
MPDILRQTILRRAMNTAPDLVPVLVRLETAHGALRAAKQVADQLPDRSAVSLRLAEIEDMIHDLIEGLR